MALGRVAGTLLSDHGKYGFIKLDSEEDGNMFVLPKSCQAFGGILPPVGTRVTFDVTLDEKTGKERAESVQPEGGDVGAPYDPEADAEILQMMSALAGGSESAPAGLLTGEMLSGSARNFGFIKQDSGEENMFVMPKACQAFGGELPPVGARVAYEVVVDEKTGKPRAENVQPLDGQEARGRKQPMSAGWEGWAEAPQAKRPRPTSAAWASPTPAAWASPSLSRQAGTMLSYNGNFGFIEQDSGEANMFCLPASCEAFGGVLPSIGSRITYEVVTDAKTGRPRAENVQPEAAWGPPFGYSEPSAYSKGTKGGKGAKGKSKPSATPALPSPAALPAGPAGKGGGYSGKSSAGCSGGWLLPDAGKGARGGDISGTMAAMSQWSVMTGTMLSDNGKFGFIQQDSGEENMFVMPLCCQGFGGQMPPPGTRVQYTVTIDTKTGRPRAEQVGPARPSGSILVDNGKFGFIQQDDGGENMFVMPGAFSDGVQKVLALPPIGTRVSYDVVVDAKTGRPRAENAQVEG